jgi:hypothetical protein
VSRIGLEVKSKMYRIYSVSVKKLKCFFGLENRVTNQQPTKRKPNENQTEDDD